MNSPVPGSVPSGPLLPAGNALLAGFSLDITAKALGELEPARAVLPAGTRVQLAFPDGGDLAGRVSTARAIKGAGFVPVPVIAARRLRSREMLREYLAALRAADASESVLVVGGDPPQPQGPYPDAAAVIGSGLLEEHENARRGRASQRNAGEHRDQLGRVDEKARYFKRKRPLHPTAGSRGGTEHSAEAAKALMGLLDFLSDCLRRQPPVRLPATGNGGTPASSRPGWPLAEMPLTARNAKLSMAELEHTEGKPQGATRPWPGS